MPAQRTASNGRSTSAKSQWKATGPIQPRPEDDPIKHVVVVMLENRSFDQMLGALQAVHPDLDGAETNGPPRANADVDGQLIEQRPVADPRMQGDPKHELPNALNQLNDGNGNFVRDFAQAYPDSEKSERRQIMAYFPVDALPGLHTLARQFKVCDRWFSSLPGPTWPNRLFVHSGTSIGHAQSPQGLHDLAKHRYNQDTLYDRLNERNISWRIYFGDFPQSMLLEHQWRPENAKHYRPMEQFYRDAAGEHYKFPAYTFIEPRYFAPHQDDDHPPHDVYGAQRLLADVYNALRGNRELWESILLVVVYDEHGGFYDHVSPPAAVPPDEHREEYSFDRLGVRVPAVLVSPWVDPGVEHTVFDHTSLLRYLMEKWNLAPLGNRAANANSLAVALRLTGAPRADAPPTLNVPEPPAQVIEEEGKQATELNELQMAMVALAMFLELQLPGGKAEEKLDRLKEMMKDPASKVRFTTSAIQRFIDSADETRTTRRAAEGPRRLTTEGHPGTGAQGRAHRKKISIKKVHHEKADKARPAGRTRSKPA
jgi:phospholipase C